MPPIEGCLFRNKAFPVRLPKSTYEQLALPTSGSLWSQALQFGAGHGGVEAIIFGLLALSTMVAMVVPQMVVPQASGLSGDAAKQMAAFWGSRTLDLLLVEPGLGLIAGSAFWLIVRLKESSPAD